MATETDKATHVYIGRKKCGCVVAVVADMPDIPDATAKDVFEFIRAGYAVERVTVADFKAMTFGPVCGTCRKQLALFTQAVCG